MALPATCLVPVLVFYVLLWREMRSVPMFDDYHAVLRFALDYQAQPGLGAKLLYLLAAQHDEYKLVVLHAVIAADLACTGHVHFGLLIWLGNLLALGIAALLWKHVNPQRLVLFAPILFLLFQLNYVENLDWAMCGLQTMAVVFFGMSALHFVLRTGRTESALACTALVFASLSSANGFLVAPIGLLWLVVERRFLAAAAWAASAAGALSVYLFHYRAFVPARPADSVTVAQKGVFFLYFVGGAVENMHHQPIPHAALVLGLGLIVILAHATYNRFYDANRFIASLAVWSFLSAALVAQVRSAQGEILSLTGRYKIYSDLLLICCYIYGIRRVRSVEPAQRLHLPQTLAIAVTLLFALAGDIAGYRFLVHRRERVALGLNQYAADPARVPPEISLGGEPFAGGDPEAARLVLNESQARGLYKLPEEPGQR